MKGVPGLLGLVYISFNVLLPLFGYQLRPLRYLFVVSFPHYSDVMISAMGSQIAGVSSVYSNVCSGTDQRKHQSLVSLAFVRGIPVNSRTNGQ